MIKNEHKQLIKYVVSDFLTALLAWSSFYFYRRYNMQLDIYEDFSFLNAGIFWYVFACIPFFWWLIYWLSGYYNQPSNKSRLGEFFTTLISVFFGCLIIFFLFLITDKNNNYEISHYKLFPSLFLFQFIYTYFIRFLITQVSVKKVHAGKWGFNTLIIGVGESAWKIYNDLGNMKKSLGYKIKGFISFNETKINVPEDKIIGSVEQLEQIIPAYDIQEVIIASKNIKDKVLFRLLNNLYPYKTGIKILPRRYELLTGSIKLSNIYGKPFVDMLHSSMPEWQKNIKRLFDIVCSFIILILLLPLFLWISIHIKINSKGKVFYKQERIGLYGEPFEIIKFRTMVVDAEAEGPSLSSENDSRITPYGRFLRKYRLDELPQFWNVLKGEMSIVGPRPERRFYIDQIEKEASYYYLLHKVRPGITSWGMVKYGYADNVKKMVRRLKYDIIYLENMSLYVDFKILIYTVITIIKGKGV